MHAKGNKGFLKLILLIVVVLIVLGFYGFNLRDHLNTPTIKENLLYVWDLIVTGWNWLVDFIKGLLPSSS